MISFEKLYLQTKDFTLLIVEDYEPLRKDMIEILEEFFYVVYEGENGLQGLKCYEDYYKSHKKFIDIVIADIQMPIMNGVELCRKIKDLNPDQQIIILSAHTDSHYLLELINQDIAQFITKPIEGDSLIETLYRVSQRLSSAQTSLDEPRTVIPLNEVYTWDSNKLVLKKEDQLINLTKHELILLALLVKKRDQLCTNSEITDEFYYQDIEISEKNIRNLIFKLRKKLPPNSVNSIYGMGYRLSTRIK